MQPHPAIASSRMAAREGRGTRPAIPQHAQKAATVQGSELILQAVGL